MRLIAIRVARRIPFQKSLVRDQHSPGRAHNRIQTEERLVGEAGERKCRLSEVPAGRAHCGGEMLAQQHIARLLEQVQNERRSREESG